MIKIEEQNIQKYQELFLSFKYFKNYIEFALTDLEIEIYVDNIVNPTQALMYANPAYFIYGKPNSNNQDILNLIKENSWLICNDKDWYPIIEKECNSIVGHQRTLFSSAKIDKIKLKESLKTELPYNLKIREISDTDISKGIIYEDVIKRFFRKSDFLTNGFGFVLVNQNNEPQGFALTNYPINSKDVEVYIRIGYDSYPKYRNQGLATELSKYFVIKALEKGYDPIWDSANETSAHIAMKLGYIEFDKWKMYNILKK